MRLKAVKQLRLVSNLELGNGSVAWGFKEEEGDSQEITKACLVISCCPATQIKVVSGNRSLSGPSPLFKLFLVVKEEVDRKSVV